MPSLTSPWLFARAIMHRALITATVLGSVLFSGLLQAEAMVWKVSSAEGTLYLGGTIHMLRASDYPLKPHYMEAFNNSDALVFETDVNATMNQAFQQKVMAQMSLPSGQTLSDLLTPKTYARLADFASQRGVPIEVLQSFKPALIITTLTQLELIKLNITPENGIETHFTRLAKTHNKPIGSLETPDEQIAMMASMGQGYENAFINGSLDDFENLEQEFDQLIQAWKDGDTATLDKKMTTMMKERFPIMYDTLLVKRNFNWIKSINRLIKTPETEFILVGAAHLVGNDSVQNLLKAQGYTLEKVRIPNTVHAL